MRINLIGGSGVMGRVHIPVFESAGHEVIISGRNSKPNIIEATKISDISIVSVPIPVTKQVIQEIGKYANALADFTSVKVMPVETMNSSTRPYVEVSGFHPLYGCVKNIKGRTVVYCPGKEGLISKILIQSFEKAGANVVEMGPHEHDEIMARLQMVRSLSLASFGMLLNKTGIDISQIYQLSPPPTKIVLDLLARQIDGRNDKLYGEMAKYNPYYKPAMKRYISLLNEVMENGYNPEKLREFFGKMLLSRQNSAKDITQRIA